MTSPIFSDSGLIALSGGIDSSLVLALACENHIHVESATIISEFTPSREIAIAEMFSKKYNVTWHPVQISLLNDSAIADNPQNRCYLCKKRIMSELLSLAKERGLSCVYDGTHADDLTSNDRPGIAALQELAIQSPLCKMTKDEIIAEAMKRNIPVYPASACLATRIPFGVPLSETLLKKVDLAENMLRDEGITGMLRVRIMGESACIEVEKEMIETANLSKEKIQSLGIRELSVREYKRGGTW